MIRCHACGASNADSADWCGQCYASLVTGQELPPATEATADPAAAAVAPEADPAAAPETPPSSEPSVEGFRKRGDTVEWQCPACGEWSAVASLACPVCATSISARWVREDADGTTPLTGRLDEPWTAAFALSAVVPGAGHIGLRRVGPGLARAVLFAVWVVGGVALLVSGGALAGGPLLLGAAVLWAGSLADVAALRAGRRELLGGRALLWLVVAVIGLSLVSLLVAVMQAPGGGAAGVG